MQQTEILAQAAAWMDENLPLAMATIVRIFGSSAQPLSARMIITTENRFVGSVSGGCVETDVYHTAQIVLHTNRPLMLHYKHVENPVIEIGLNCDGKIDVVVERLERDLLDQLTAEGPHVNVTLCCPGQPTAPDVIHAQVFPYGTPSFDLPAAVVQDALAALKHDPPVSVTYPDGRVALFEPVLPPPTILIFGGEQIAVPLVRLAHYLGFRVVVTDARPAFATPERHPEADLVLAAWPDQVLAQIDADERTYVVSLNHEPRFEDAMLRALVGKSVPYIGAIGKPVRQQERIERAAEAGVDLDQLPRIYTPIGLNIGGRSPEEIALSIISEIVAVRNGRRDIFDTK